MRFDVAQTTRVELDLVAADTVGPLALQNLVPDELMAIELPDGAAELRSHSLYRQSQIFARDGVDLAR